MIFVANVLTMNGGTTFLIRMCRELKRRGRSVSVLVLFPIYDKELRNELALYAQIFDLKTYLWEGGNFFRTQLMTFAPMRWTKLFADLHQYGNTVHVMGVFGLIFACRGVYRNPELKITVGIYHQNEFLFKAESSYFVRKIREFFCLINLNQILFFNETSKKNYSKFFGFDYSSSLIAPIGIDLPKMNNETVRESNLKRLVSVGNLVNFKTYNKHVIEIVSKLSTKYPYLQYEIYGSGPEENELKNLSKKLHVEDKIKFMGDIPYSDLSLKLKGSSIFIGSGTVLLEAAALGIPALIGIESMQEPKTYGFLSVVKDYSYNEYMPEMHLEPMDQLIEKIISDSSYEKKISTECKKKSTEFSIEKTANILENLIDNAYYSENILNPRKTVLMFFSFLIVILFDFIGVSSNFRNRRDQSF